MYEEHKATELPKQEQQICGNLLSISYHSSNLTRQKSPGTNCTKLLENPRAFLTNQSTAFTSCVGLSHFFNEKEIVSHCLFLTSICSTKAVRKFFQEIALLYPQCSSDFQSLWPISCSSLSQTLKR